MGRRSSIDKPTTNDSTNKDVDQLRVLIKATQTCHPKDFRKIYYSFEVLKKGIKNEMKIKEKQKETQLTNKLQSILMKRRSSQ